MLWTGLLLLVLAAVCLAETETVHDCDSVFQAAVDFRAFLKRYGYFREGMRYAMQNYGINLSDDEEMKFIICSAVEANPKTIPAIIQSSHDFDNRQFAFAYTSFLRTLEYEMSVGVGRLRTLEEKVRFYDETGFPEFPSKYSADELSIIVNEFSNETLGGMFRWFADNHYGGDSLPSTFQVDFERDEFVAALAEASSLEEFIKRAFKYEYKSSYSYSYSYNYADGETLFDQEYIKEDMRNAVDEARQYPQDARNRLTKQQASVQHTIPFYNTLKEAGILNITRGGPPLYSCDFIGDTAVEAMRYTVEIFGRKEVRRTMINDMGLSFLEDDDCALRSLVCSLFSSKSVEELGRILFPSRQNLALYNVYDKHGMFGEIEQILLRPGRYLSEGMAYLRLAKAADRVDFLDFPMSMTEPQAQQFTTVLLGTLNHHSADTYDQVDDVAQKLMDADTLDDAVDNDLYFLRHKAYVLEEIEGKTDTILKLASCVYQLLLSAEEHGLFMLPTTAD